jgi:hypothetical protein
LTLQGFVSQQSALRAAGMEAHFPTHTVLAAREFREGGGWLTTRGALSYAHEMNHLAENMWTIYRGGMGVVNQRKADIWGAIRNLNVATMLGAAALSGVSDLSFQHQARAFAGLPVHRTWGDMLAAFRRDKRAAVRAGLLLDTATSVLHNEARWAGSMQGPVWSQIFADRVIAYSGLQAWTQAGRHAWGLAVQGELVERAGLAFDALPAPLRRLLQRYGLTAGDWDAIRIDGNGQVRNGDFLSPSEVFHTLEAAERGGERIAERYLEMILQEAEYAVPQGTLRAKAASGQARPRGTNIDELIRSAAQFKMFGFTIALQQGRRIASEMVTSGLWRGAGMAGALFITTTLYGALAMQLKEIAKGRDPRPMDDTKFWGGAILQGGGLGIFGDFFAAETNRVGGGLAQTMAGPTVDRLGGLLALSSGNVAQRVRGENTNFGREAVRFVGQNTPGGSLWYLRLAYERLVLDQLQQLADPEARSAFQRRVQTQRRDYGNAFYWAPGELVPRWAPELIGRE